MSVIFPGGGGVSARLFKISTAHCFTRKSAHQRVRTRRTATSRVAIFCTRFVQVEKIPFRRGSLYKKLRFSLETRFFCTDFVHRPGIVDFLAFCMFFKLLILKNLSCGKLVRLPPPRPFTRLKPNLLSRL